MTVWKLLDRAADDIAVRAAQPSWTDRGRAWHGSTGAGVSVCVVDSGVEAGHPLVGEIASSHAVVGSGSDTEVVEAEPGDLYGHGTACASVLRTVAPDCEVHSVRVLGPHGGGTGRTLLAGLRWAVEQGFDVVNLSLSTARPQFEQALREVVDAAYFGGTVIVASAHNARVESWPWRFSSVVSVGSHTEPDPDLVLYNPEPPVEFFARGQAVPVAGLGGTTTRSTGNSLATPHVAGRCALLKSAHRALTPFELKAALYLTAANVRSGPG